MVRLLLLLLLLSITRDGCMSRLPSHTMLLHVPPDHLKCDMLKCWLQITPHLSGLDGPKPPKSLHGSQKRIHQPGNKELAFQLEKSSQQPQCVRAVHRLPAGPFDWWLSPCCLHLLVPLLTPPMSLEVPCQALRQGRPCGSAGWRGSDRQA